MTRGVSAFRQSNLTRALKAAQASGLDPQRVEIDPASGKIVVLFKSGDAAPVSDFDKWKAGRAG